MKYFLATISFLLLFSTAAFAADIFGRVTAVQPLSVTHYQEIVETVCQETYNPVYREHGPSTGQIVGGALIGGIIGNQIGDGSGRDVSTVVGTILGATIASNSHSYSLQGYQPIVTCNNVITTRPVTLHDGYIVYYNVNGYNQSFHSHTQYSIGDRILLSN